MDCLLGPKNVAVVKRLLCHFTVCLSLLFSMQIFRMNTEHCVAGDLFEV